MTPLSAELQFLIEGHLAGTLDESQQQQLMELLRADASARRLFLEYMDLNAELQWSLQSRYGASLATEVFSGGVNLETQEVDSPAETATNSATAPIVFDTEGDSAGAATNPFASAAKPWTLLLGGFVTFGLLALALLIFRGGTPTDSVAKPKAAEVAAQPYPSSLELTSGRAKLMLPQVGYVVLEGPGEFILLSEKRARLTSGRIKMRVTEVTGRGFVVETPYGEITDLGTEFGVDLTEQGKAGLVVFEGSVDLRVARNSERPPSDKNYAQRLVGGEGIVFNDRGHFDRIGSISTGNIGTFLRSSEKSADGTTPLIVEVADNLRKSETIKFYGIVPAGLKEDAQAYVDRPHEWNGVQEAGMPVYLCDADYVKTFNEDKERSDLRISVTLGRPAKLYVFYDKRLAVADWLRRDFRDTGDTIGLDENNWGRSERLRIASGPGNSIDNFFSVWERIVKEPGTVELGAINFEPVDENNPPLGVAMYGIAAVPLDSGEVNVSVTN